MLLFISVYLCNIQVSVPIPQSADTVWGRESVQHPLCLHLSPLIKAGKESQKLTEIQADPLHRPGLGSSMGYHKIIEYQDWKRLPRLSSPTFVPSLIEGILSGPFLKQGVHLFYEGGRCFCSFISIFLTKWQKSGCWYSVTVPQYL